jgi:hypothetical protein
MAKSPSETIYCEPLSNTASIIVMVFLLFGNINNPQTDNFTCAYRVRLTHSPCHPHSFQQLDLNSLKYCGFLADLSSANVENHLYPMMDHG